MLYSLSSDPTGLYFTYVLYSAGLLLGWLLAYQWILNPLPTPVLTLRRVWGTAATVTLIPIVAAWELQVWATYLPALAVALLVHYVLVRLTSASPSHGLL